MNKRLTNLAANAINTMTRNDNNATNLITEVVDYNLTAECGCCGNEIVARKVEGGYKLGDDSGRVVNSLDNIWCAGCEREWNMG